MEIEQDILKALDTHQKRIENLELNFTLLTRRLIENENALLEQISSLENIPDKEIEIIQSQIDKNICFLNEYQFYDFQSEMDDAKPEDIKIKS